MRSTVQARRSSMRRVAALLTTILFLGASNSEAFAMACAYAPPSVVVRCPPLKSYSAEASRELGLARARIREVTPQNPVLAALDDYYAHRQACRALEAPK